MLSMKKRHSVGHDNVALTATENHAATAPDIRRKTGTMRRKAQGKRSQKSADNPGILANLIADERWIECQIERLPGGVHRPALDANTEVAVDEIPQLGAAAE